MAASESFPTPETARTLGILPEEFEQIKQSLGRNPTVTELHVFSVMWSERNPARNSRFWLEQLPHDSDRMLAGKENAGLVNIGDGLACSFRAESHDYVIAPEVNQATGTGVRGLNRGMFTTGARPIARLNAIHAGDLKLDETRQLLLDVVKRINKERNTSGTPTVGSKLYIDACYKATPLVDVFSASIVDIGQVASAKADGIDNPVFIVDSATTERLPAEAVHEISATEHVVAIQNIGVAGIVGSIAEISANGEYSIRIDLDNVPTRQPDMAPSDMLLSNSQGQLILVVEKGAEEALRGICDRWKLTCVQIGEVTAPAEAGAARPSAARLQFYRHGERVVDVPVNDLISGGDAASHQREYQEPAYIAEYATFDIEDVDDLKLDKVSEVAAHLLAHPNICSRQWLYEQEQSTPGVTNRRTDEPSDAAIIRIKELVVSETATQGAGLPDTETSIVLTVDGNSRYVNASPRQGAMIAVVEAARNIVCSGGDPLAVTTSLNFVDPHVSEAYWQFVEAVQGIGEACRRFSTPVMGSNVNFYTQRSAENPMFPTPAIGMVGIMEDPSHRMTLNFKNEGDRIYLIGPTTDDIASSEYLYSYREIKASPAPFFDFQTEWRVQEGIRTMIRNGWIKSAHDVSDGGLFVTLAESAMAGNKGFAIESNERYRLDAFLFGEGQSRVVVTVSPDHFHYVEAYLDEGYNVFTRLGSVTAADFVVDETRIMTSAEARNLYDNALGKMMENE